MIDVKSYLYVFLIMILYCLGINLINIILSTPTPCLGDFSYHHNLRNLGNVHVTSSYYITYDLIKLMFACVVTLFYFLYNFISLKVMYVTFDTNLSLLRKNVNHKVDQISHFCHSGYIGCYIFYCLIQDSYFS